MKSRPSFGEFIAQRYGPKWVYAARNSAALRRQYGRDVRVILPREQERLREDYHRLYGRERDEAHWRMLCALRAVTQQLDYGNFDKPTQTMVQAAIEYAETHI